MPQLFIETDDYSRDFIIKLAAKEYMHKDDVEKLLTLYEIGEKIYLKNNTFDFSNVVEKALFNSVGFSDRREEYFSWVFGIRDRLAGKRVAEQVYNLI